MRTFYTALLVTLTICAISILPVRADLSPADQVRDTIDNALAHPYMARGFHGVYVRSMDTGRVIYDHNGDHLLTPASCMKVLVTSAALDLLGPDYKMTTSLYATANPGQNGVLNGDLVLVGQGDSTLRTEHLQQMVAKLKQMGIRSIKGNIVGDDTWFDGAPLGTGCCYDDEPYYYSAQVSGLNLNENFVNVYIHPGAKVGAPAVVEVNPITCYMTIKNDCITGAIGSANTADSTRLHGKNVIYATGSIPLNTKGDANLEQISVDDPTIFVCTTFKELLQKNGIKVMGQPVRGTKPKQAILLATHDSPPLSEVVHILNKPSNNFMAECLLKTVGKATGKGTFDAGIEAETLWLQKIGADMREINIADASGLSRRNSISPRNLVTVLTYMYHTKNYDTLANSFPIAGVDSHLKNRMLNTPAVNNVKAKTGYVSRVCSLSGYVKTLAGENLAVSIVQNNHMCSLDEANVIQDIIFVALSKITTRTDAGIDAQKN